MRIKSKKEIRSLFSLYQETLQVFSDIHHRILHPTDPFSGKGIIAREVARMSNLISTMTDDIDTCSYSKECTRCSGIRNSRDSEDNKKARFKGIAEKSAQQFAISLSKLEQEVNTKFEHEFSNLEKTTRDELVSHLKEAVPTLGTDLRTLDGQQKKIGVLSFPTNMADLCGLAR